MKRALAVVLVAALAVACQDHGPTDVPPGPLAAISDGAHNSGNPDFFFLPPIASNPSSDPNFEPAEFNAALGPTVEVCTWLGTACGAVVASFTTTSGLGSETIQVGVDQYAVNWHTDLSNLNPDLTYRIRVLVGSTQLGFADVDVVSTGRELRNVNTQEFIGLQDGRTLPIKFRIENGALCEPAGSDACASETIDLSVGGEVIIPHTGDRIDIPPQTSGQVVTLTIQYCDGIETDLLTFGPCLHATADPPLSEGLSPRAVVSICSLGPITGLTEEQEDLVTLLRRDGEVITALPHAHDACAEVIGNRATGFRGLLLAGWNALATVLGPGPLHASLVLLDVGGGGETTEFSDFQFSLPAQMEPVEGTEFQAAQPGSPVANPPAVRVTDADGAIVEGVTVHFEVTRGNGTITPFEAASDAQGIARVSEWVLGLAGLNTVRAYGAGVADPADEGPFMPDISDPTAEQEAVPVGSGEVLFNANALAPDAVAAGLGTPSVDGTIDGSEWDAAGQVTFGVALPEGGSAAGTLYVMNDATSMYLAVRFPRAAADPGNSLSFELDNDNDGVMENGDDVLLVNPSPGVGFKDEVRTDQPPCPEGAMCGFHDTDVGGTSDGSGAFANGSGLTVYEMSHPLNSADDAHDISLAFGQQFGLKLSLRLLAAGAEFPVGFGDSDFPLGPYLKVTVATPPPPPDGSDQVNDPEASTSFGCGDGGMSLYQSFLPVLSPLSAVELRLRAGGSVPSGGTSTSINIRDGSPTGAILGSATAFVPGPVTDQVLVRYVFTSPISVTPGSPLVIEWLSPAPAGQPAGTILTWMGTTTNPYAGGTMFGCGQTAAPDIDLNFRTFWGPQVDPVVASVTVTPEAAALSGGTQTFTATAWNAAGVILNKPFTWFSFNADVASVSAFGEATPISSGQATISATTDGVSGYALATVAVPGATPVNLWTRMTSGTTEVLFDVWGTSRTNVYAAGDGGTIQRFDGTSWTAASSGTTTTLYGVWGTSPDNLLAVGQAGVIRQFDGSSWSAMTSPTPEHLRGGVWGASPADAFTVGTSGSALRFNGTTWSALSTGTSLALFHVWGTSPADVYAVGLNGTILHFDGAAWSTVSAGSTANLYGVWGTSPSQLFAVGDQGSILRFDGSTWSAMTSGTTNYLSSVWGSSATDVYAVGGGGSVLRFDGSSWSDASGATTEDLLRVWGTSGGDVYAVGVGGTVLRGVRGATVMLTPASHEFNTIGATQQLTATARDANGNVINTSTSYTWFSDDAAVVTVNGTGMVTAVGNGTTVITATAPGGAQGSATVTVDDVRPTSIRLVSDAGDFVGQGRTYEYSQANSVIEVTSTDGHLTLRIRGDELWNGEFQVPNTLTRLEPGSYTGLRRYGFHDPAVGGLSWTGEGRGCNTLTGSFTVDRVAYVGNTLTAIDLGFEQHCEGATPALRGEIHWSAGDPTLPPDPVSPVPAGLWEPAPGSTPTTGNYVHLVSDAGDFIGQGQTYTYTPGSATITVSAVDGHLTVTVNDGQVWTGNFQTMYTLSQLEPGYYPDLRRYGFHNPAKGGLDWSGHGRGCNTLRGWFAIDRVTYASGILTAVDLRFEQRCEGGTTALHGVIHWEP